MDSLPVKDDISKETLDSLDESILNTKNACFETEQQLETEEIDEDARNALIFQLQKQRLDYARLHVKKVALLRKLVESDADQTTFSKSLRGQHTFSNHAEISTNVWPDKRGTSQRTTTYSIKVRRLSGEEQIQQSDELRKETESESDPFKAPIRGIDTDASTSYEDIPTSTRYTQPPNICDTLENALSFFQRSTADATISSFPGRTSPFDHLEETNIGTKVDEVILLGSGPDGPSASSTLERKERIIDQRQIVDQQVHFIHEHIKSYRLETVLSLAEAQLLSERGGLQVAKELGKMASTKTVSTDLDVFDQMTPIQPKETRILWKTTDLAAGKLCEGVAYTSGTEEDSGIKTHQAKYGEEQQEEGLTYSSEPKEHEAESPSLLSQKIVTGADLLSEQNEQLLQTKIAPTPKPRSRTPIKDISGIHEEDTSTGDAKPDTALFKEQSIREGQLKTTQIERINELREEPETFTHPISKESPGNFEPAPTSLVKHREEHLAEDPDKISSSSAETVVTAFEQPVVKLEPCPVAHSLRDTLAEVTHRYPEEEIYDEGVTESASKGMREGKETKLEEEGFKESLEVKPVVKSQDLGPSPVVALKSAIEEEIFDMQEEVTAISIQEKKLREMPKTEKTGRIRKMAEEMEKNSEKGMFKEPIRKREQTGKTKAMTSKFEDTIQQQRPEILKRSKDVKAIPLEFTKEQPSEESLEALPKEQERIEEITSDEIVTVASNIEENELNTAKPDTSPKISGREKEDTTEELFELLAEPDTYLQEERYETSTTPENIHMEQNDFIEDFPVPSLEEEIQAKQLSALQKYKIKNRKKYEAEQEEMPIKFEEKLETEEIKRNTEFEHGSAQMLQKGNDIVTELLKSERVQENYHLLGQPDETVHFEKTAEKIDTKFEEAKVESEVRGFGAEIIQEKEADEISDIPENSKTNGMEALEIKDREIHMPREPPMSVEDSEIITILEAESRMRQKVEETTVHQKLEDAGIHQQRTGEPSSNIEDPEAVKLRSEHESEEQSTAILSGTFTEVPLTSDPSPPASLQLLLYVEDLEHKPLSAIQKYHLAQVAAKLERSRADEPKKAEEELGRIRKMAKEIQEAAQNIEQEKPVLNSEKDKEIETRIREIEARQAIGKGRESSRAVHGGGKIKNIAEKMETLAQVASGQYEVLRRQRDLKSLPMVFEETQEKHDVRERTTLLSTGISDEAVGIEPVGKPKSSQKDMQSSQTFDPKEFDFEDVKDMEEELKTLEVTEDSSSSHYSSDEPMLPEELDNLVQSIVSTSKSPASRTKSAPVQVKLSSAISEADTQEVESMNTEIMTAENERNIFKEFEESRIKLTYELEESTEHIRVKRTPTGEIIEETSTGPDTDSHLEVQNEPVKLLNESEPRDESLNILSRSAELTPQLLSNLQKFRLHRNIEKAGESPPSHLGAGTAKSENIGRIKQMAEKVETDIQAMTGHYDVLKRTRDLKRTPLEIQPDAELIQSKISAVTTLTEPVHEMPTSELLETKVAPVQTQPPIEALQTSQIEVEPFSERTDESMQAKFPDSKSGIWKTAEKVPIESEWERPPSRKSSAHMLGRLLSDIQEREDEDEQRGPESKLSTLSEVVILHWLEPETDMEYEPLEIMQQAMPQYVNEEFKQKEEENQTSSQTALSRSGGIVQRLVEEYDETGIETVVEYVLEPNLDYENRLANVEGNLSPLADSKENQDQIEPDVTSPAEPSSSEGLTAECEIGDIELGATERSQRMFETVAENSYDVINAEEDFEDLANITLDEEKADISYVTEEIPVYDSSVVQTMLRSNEDKKETATLQALAKETGVETQTFGTGENNMAIVPEFSHNIPNMPEERPSEGELYRVDSRQLHYEEIFSQDLSTEFIPELAAELPSRKITVEEADEESRVENLEKEPELHSRNMTITLSSQIPLHPDLVEGASVFSLALETEEERNRKAIRDNLANERKEGDTFVTHELRRTFDLLPSILEILPESHQSVDVSREQPYISTSVSTRDDHKLEASQEMTTKPATFTTKTTATFVIKDKAKVDSTTHPGGSDTQLSELNVPAADTQISVPGTSKASETAPALITRCSFRRSVGVQANPLYSQVGMQTESGQSRTTNIGTQSEVSSAGNIRAIQHSLAEDGLSSVDLEIHTEPFTASLGDQAELRRYADASLQTDGYLTGIDDEHQLLHLHEEQRPLNECPSLKIPVDTADAMAQTKIQPELGNVTDIEIIKELREQLSSSAVQTSPILMKEAKGEIESHQQEHPSQIAESQNLRRHKERTLSESELERVRETLEAIRNIIHSPITDQQPPIVVEPQRRPLETLAEIQERSSQSLEIDLSSESESYEHKTVEGKSSSEVERDMEPAQHCGTLLRSVDLQWLPVIPPRRTVDDNTKFLEDLEKVGLALDVNQHPNYKEVIEAELKAIRDRQMIPEMGEVFTPVVDRETDEELLDGDEGSDDVCRHLDAKSFETPAVPQRTEKEYPPEPLYRIDEEERSETSEERPKSISLEQKSDKSNEPHLPVANIEEYADSAKQIKLIPLKYGKGQETIEYRSTAIDTCRAPVKPRRSDDLLLERSQEIEEGPISVNSSESKSGHDFREDQLRIIKHTLDAVNRHLQNDEITAVEHAEIVEETDLDLYYQDSMHFTDKRHPLDSGEFGLRMDSRSPSLRISPTNDNERLLKDIRDARRLLGKRMCEAKTHKSSITVSHREADHLAIETKERNRPMPLDLTSSNIVKDYDLIHERLQLQPPPVSLRRPSLPEYRPPSPVVIMDLNNIPLLSPTSMHFHIFDQYLQQHNWQMPYFLVPKDHELLGHCKWPLIERVIPSFLEAAAEILMRSAHLATDRVIVIQTINQTGRRSDFPRKFSKASEEVLSPPMADSDYTVTQFQFTDPIDRPIRPKKRFNLYYDVDEAFIPEKDEDELDQWHKMYRGREEPIRSLKNEGPYADDLETETDLDENASVGSEEGSVIPKDSMSLWTQPHNEKRSLVDELKYIIIRSEPSENISPYRYPEIIPERLLIKDTEKPSEYEYELPIELDEPQKEESENKVNLPEVVFNPNEARFVIFRRSKRAKDPKRSMVESTPQIDAKEKDNQTRSPKHELQETKIQTVSSQFVKLKSPAQITNSPSPADHRSETAIELAGVLARRLKRLEDIEQEKLQKSDQSLQDSNITDSPKTKTVSFHHPKEVESAETKKMSPFGGRKSFLKSGKMLQISDGDFDETKVMRSGRSEQSKQPELTSVQFQDYGLREKALEKRKPEDNTSQTDTSVVSLPSHQPKAPSTQPEQIQFAHSHIQTLNPVSVSELSRPALKSVQLRQTPAKRKKKPEDSGAFNSDSESEQEDKYVRRASKLFRHLDREYLKQKEEFAGSGPRLYTIRFARPPILSIVGNRKHYIAMPELYDGLHNTNGTQSDTFGLNGKDESDHSRQWDPTTLLNTKLYKVDYNPLVEKRNRFRTMEGHLEVPNDETNIVPEIENAWKRLYFRTKDGRFQWFANHCADEHPTEDVLLTGTTITANKDEWTLEVKGGKENANITVRAPSNLFEKWRQALLSNSHSTIIDAYVQPVYPPVPHYTHKVVLIELGTCSVRAGILTNKPSLPQTFFPAVGCVTAAGEVFVGVDAFKPDIRSQGQLQSPLQTAEHQNLVERYKLNKVVLEACLRKVLTDLRVDPSQHKVLLSVPQNIPTVFICDLLRSLLRELRFKAASIARQPSLILYSYDVTTGVVVDIGERLNIVPVIDEYIVESAIISLPFGAQQIRDSLKKNLRERNSGTICSFSSAVEQIFLRHIMEQSCYVATDFEEEAKKANDVETTVNFDKFLIGSGMDSKFTVDASRFHATEGLFKPKRWGLEMKGIHQLIHDAIQQSPIDSRRTLYRNIYLTGGTSLLPGLAERLETELAKIAPSSIFVQVHGSPWRYHSGYLGSQIIANSFQFENCCADLNNLDEYIGQLEKSIN